MSKIKTKRLNTGLYEFSYAGRNFEVEDIRNASDSESASGWMVYEIVKGERNYLNDFNTKRDAVYFTQIYVDAGRF